MFQQTEIASFHGCSNHEQITIRRPRFSSVICHFIDCVYLVCAGSLSNDADKHLTSEYSGSIWSVYNFDWYSPIIDKGYKGELQLDDLPVSF